MPSSAPSFPLATRLCVALYALVFIAFAGFSYTEGNPTALILLLPDMLLAWILVDSPQPRVRDANGVPKAILNLLVLGAACNLWYEVVSDYGHQALVVSLTHFILALTLCKLLERKTPRDITQLIVLSLLIIISSTMFSASGLLFFLLLAVYFAILFYVAMLVNLSRELSHAAQASPPLFDVPQSTSWPGLHRDLRDAVRHCLFLVLPIAIIVFLALPRSRSATLMSPWASGPLQTGFTDTVQFRDYGQLNLSDTPVMTVWLAHDIDGESRVTSEYNDLYFRGRVLEQYNAQNWRWEPGSSQTAPQASPATTPALETATAASSPTPPATDTMPSAVQPSGEELTAHFDLEPSSGRTLFCLAPLQAPSDKKLAYSNADMTLRLNGDRPLGKFQYSVIWLPKAQNLNNSPTITPGSLRAAKLGQPEVHVSPEITALAQRLAGKLLNAEQRVAPEDARYIVPIFENYLRNNYPYSLTFKQVYRTKDPTTDFLLNRRQTGGYCDYFASAMVMMCRAIGLNARIVVGFHGGQYIDNSVIVRQKDAHTWAEVYLQDQGWVTSDPTPAAAESTSSFRFLGRWFGDLSTVIQNLWLSRVVSFDNDSRHAIAAWFSRRLDQRSWMVSRAFWKSFFAGLWGPCAAAVLTLTVGWSYRRWHKNPRLLVTVGALATQRHAHPEIAFLDALLHHLERPGHHRRPDQTPLEFLQPHLPEFGSAAPDAHWLVQTAYGIRFGHVQPTADLRCQIALALRRLKAALQTHP